MAARETLITLSDPAAWTAALQGIPHGFAHTWDCCSAVHHTTGHPIYLYCWEDAAVRVVCPIAERSFRGHVDVATPFGFSGFVANGPAPHFSDHWRAFAERRGYVCGYFAVHPTLGQLALHGPASKANTVYVLNLSLGLEALWARLNRSRRRDLHAWRKSGRLFLEERDRLKDFLIANQERFLRLAGASPRNILSDETLNLLCASPAVELIGVESDGEVVALHACARTSWDSEGLFLIALPEGRKFITALYWEAARRSIALGLPTLNMGGGINPDDAIAFAKSLYGAGQHEFHCVKEVYDRKALGRLCQEMGMDVDAAGYFPPYRRGLFE